MNKIASEIIAGVIPHKMTRNRWRGLLRYGLFNIFNLKRQISKNKTTPQHYLSVCAIAKNEGPYFKEWIEWHKKMGVEKFYIYDNESTDNTKDVLQPYIDSGLVDYVYWPGSRQQLAVYDDCFNRHRFETRWLAVIDLDEFIVPVRDKSIPDFLKGMEKFSSVEINWLCYGSSGAKTNTGEPLMRRFKRHSISDTRVNRHVKSIVNPRCVSSMIGAHEAARISGKSADSHGKILRKGFRDRIPQHDVIKINHYAVKSYEEFLSKHSKGSVRTGNERGMSYFDRFDLNDIYEE
ncbi:MAG: glycosyltransferase family 92 protein [Muribaculaceae bacterium]|nr:glycosyltransferase family 92 protein [Muribaculaceae bacterium]